MLRHFLFFFLLFCSSLAAGQSPQLITVAKEKMELGQYQSALNILSQLDSSEYTREVLYRYGISYRSLNRWDEAWETCEALLEIDSNHVPTLALSAQIAGNRGADTLAFKFWQKLVRSAPDEAFYHKEFAESSMRIGLLPLAIYHYNKALELNPYFLNSRIQLAELYENLQMYDKADSLVRSGLEYSSRRKELLLLAARVWYRAESFGRTVHYLEEADSISTLNSTWNEIYAISLSRYGMLERSVQVMKRIPPSEMEESSAYVLGMSYFRLNEFDSAAVYFKMAADLSISDNISLYLEYNGRSLQKELEFDAAIDAFSDAYFFQPNDPVFTYLIARSYDEAGNRERASEYYKSYLELESDEASSYYEYALDRLSEWKKQDFFEGK